MPFSLSSYLLGVGTVVGALGFGFGGGVLLTKTAMKDTPVAETRVERVKRADSPSPSAPLQPVETVEKATPSALPRAEPAAPAAGPAPPVQASTEPPKTEAPKPIAEAPTPAEPAKAAVITARRARSSGSNAMPSARRKPWRWREQSSANSRNSQSHQDPNTCSSGLQGAGSRSSGTSRGSIRSTYRCSVVRGSSRRSIARIDRAPFIAAFGSVFSAGAAQRRRG